MIMEHREKMHMNANDVLENAIEYGLKEVAIAGLDQNDEVVVFSNIGGLDTVHLLGEGIYEIGVLTSESDD